MLTCGRNIVAAIGADDVYDDNIDVISKGTCCCTLSYMFTFVIIMVCRREITGCLISLGGMEHHPASIKNYLCWQDTPPQRSYICSLSLSTSVYLAVRGGTSSLGVVGHAHQKLLRGSNIGLCKTGDSDHYATRECVTQLCSTA